MALISADHRLIASVEDAAAAVGLRLTVASTLAEAAPVRAAALLIGTDAAGQPVRGAARHADALVVGPDGDTAGLWAAAGQVAAAGAVSLPSGGAWLVQWLHGRCGSGSASPAVVAACFSAAGGVGASTLTAAVAVTAAEAGLRPMLIDAHPGPAGVDLLLGDATASGHWSRFAAIRGFLDPGALADLPVLEGVRCLGWGTGRDSPLWHGALGSVVAAAQRDHDLVVVDAGLHAPVYDELPRATRAVLLVPATWRGVLAAQSRLTALQESFDEDPVVVLRDVGGTGDPRGWAQEFPASPIVHLGFDPAVIVDEEHCRPPGTRRRRPVGRCARQLLAALAQPAAAA